MLLGDGDAEKHHFEAACFITFDTEFDPASKKKFWECEPGKWQITDNEMLNYVINLAIWNYALMADSEILRITASLLSNSFVWCLPYNFSFSTVFLLTQIPTCR